MEVQVCDFRTETFKGDFIHSVVNTGFAVVTNHGISHDLIDRAKQGWRKFFLSGQNRKNLFVNGNDTNMGYKGFGSEKAVGAKVADLKEFFHYKPGYDIPEESEKATAVLFKQLGLIGSELLSVIDDHMARHMLENTSYEFDCQDSDNTLFRALYYPALNSIPTKKDGIQNAVRAAAHEDINFITLLVAASAPGLEVLDNNGMWHKVPHEENSIVVNIGDMLQLASEGLFKSTTHRVVNADDGNSDRVSMPLFIHPHSDTVLAPGVTAKKYLDERIAQIYGAKK